MTEKRCWANNKLQFKNASDASRAMAEKWRVHHATVDTAQMPLRVYRCQHCRRWHMTSMTAEQSREVESRRKLGVRCATTGENQ